MSSGALIEVVDEFEGCEERSEDGSDNGSDLEDFLVADDDHEVDCSATDRCAVTVSNIRADKRKRTPTVFYKQQVYSSAEYLKMVLDDVGEDEYEAALEEDVDGESGSEEEEDAEYVPGQEEVSDQGEETEDDDDTDDEEEAYNTDDDESQSDTDDDNDGKEEDSATPSGSEVQSHTEESAHGKTGATQVE
jgi:hypothetical protein